MKSASTRISGLDTTIFARITELATAHDAINLGQGFPDTDGPDVVIEAAVEALRGGRNQYAPGRGVPELRAAIAAHQWRFYGLEVDPATEIAVTTGATEAIAAALLALVDDGDEVVALEPYYDSYAACIQLAGGVRKPVTLRAPDFRPDLDEFRAAITDKTRVILLNSPHNPTGTVLTDDEFAAIASLAIEHDLVVISDEVYEHLTFGAHRHTPIATLPGMAERTLTISSGGKSFSFTGWKIGWATGPAALIDALLAAKQFLSYTSGSPLQPAIAKALVAGDSYFDALRDQLQTQRDLFCAGLADIGFEVFVPDGTYFVTTDIRPLGFDDGMEFCLTLPERVGVAAIPTQVFYDDTDAGRPLVRWSFCKQPAVLAEALHRLEPLRSRSN